MYMSLTKQSLCQASRSASPPSPEPRHPGTGKEARISSAEIIWAHIIFGGLAQRLRIPLFSCLRQDTEEIALFSTWPPLKAGPIGSREIWSEACLEA